MHIILNTFFTKVLPWLFVHLGELLHHPHYMQGARDELR